MAVFLVQVGLSLRTFYGSSENFQLHVCMYIPYYTLYYLDNIIYIVVCACLLFLLHPCWFLYVDRDQQPVDDELQDDHQENEAPERENGIQPGEEEGLSLRALKRRVFEVLPDSILPPPKKKNKGLVILFVAEVFSCYATSFPLLCVELCALLSGIALYSYI